MLDVTELTVKYAQVPALDRISFHLENGERCALIGANGAGKTTLLLSLVGVTSGEGSISAGGLALNRENLSAVRRKVGMVFQNPDDQLFLPTIIQDVCFGLENMGVAGSEQLRRAEACLERLGIAHLRDRSALTLSGGEKRMAALATVLVMEPELLLLDEPTAFLDPGARRRLINTLSGLPQTMLIATHDLSLALTLCPRTILLRQGRILAEGASREILFDPDRMGQAGVEDIRTFYGGLL